MAIDIGPGASNRSGVISGAGYTDIDLANPANDTGTLNSVEIWANVNLTGCKIGTFYLVGGVGTCRDSVSIGNVTAGSKQTFTGLGLQVVTGDYLGIYYTGGKMERDATGGSGIRWFSGECMTPGQDETFNYMGSEALSIYATGVDTTVTPVASDGVTLGDSASVSLGYNVVATDGLVMSDGPPAVERGDVSAYDTWGYSRWGLGVWVGGAPDAATVIKVELEAVDGLVLGESFQGPTITEDFEWGSDGDAINTSGGSLVWTKSASGGSLCEIDTAQAYAGTRSLGIYDAASNYPYAVTALVAASYGYSIKVRTRRPASSSWVIWHGNGTYCIYIYSSPSTNAIIHMDHAGAYISTGITQADDAWNLVELRNIDFVGGYYDFWWDGAFVKRCEMRSTATATNVVRLVGAGAAKWAWYDDFQIVPVQTPLITLAPAASDGAVVSDTAPLEFEPPSVSDLATTLIIDGTAYVMEEGSLSLETRIGERSTASLNVIDLAASYVFPDYAYVEVYRDSFTVGNLLFAGFISPEDLARNGATSGTIHSVSCCDMHYLADKRLAAETYENKTAGYIVADLLTTYLAGEGVTAGTIQTGPTIAAMSINYARVSDAMDKLAELADFVWWIDQYRRLYFVDRTTVDAPWDFTAEKAIAPPRLTKGNSSYRNRQYCYGTALTDLQTEDFTGDGAIETFTCAYPLAKVPTVTVDSVAQDVGIKGVDTGKDFYWSKGDATVSAETPPDAAAVVEIAYYGEYPVIVLSTDDAEVAARAATEASTGYVEDIYQEDALSSLESVWQSANARLVRYCRSARRFCYQTETDGLFPGQYQHITDALLGLDEDMLIESVTMTKRLGAYVYDVTCIVGPDTGSWTRFFKALAAPIGAIKDAVSVGLESTLIVIANVSDATEWADSATESVSACPVCSAATLCGASTIVC